MEAPKLPSFFRNVRQNPRRFHFKSMHYDPQKAEWENRKAGIDREVGEVEDEMVDSPREIRFSRTSRRPGSYKAASKSAAYRLIVILIILLFLTYRGLVWLEIWQ